MKTTALANIALTLVIISCSNNTISDININVNIPTKLHFNKMQHKAATPYHYYNQRDYH